MLHLMPWALLDVLDVALKLAAAFLAIRLIRFTRGRWVWFAMAGALLLRALRRLLPLLAPGGWPDRAGFPPAPEQAFVSLLVSSLFVAALWKLRDYLEESRQTEDLLAAEASRRESEGRYRALFEQAGDYALVLEPREDGSLIILDVNEAALQAHGYARAELVGQPLSVLDPFQDPELLAPRLKAIRQHGMALFQVKHRRKDGSLFDAEVRTTLVHLD
ncbi:MAG TPA: PAS domain S-box protein, partial [Holophagaceae bacterium]